MTQKLNFDPRLGSATKLASSSLNSFRLARTHIFFQQKKFLLVIIGLFITAIMVGCGYFDGYAVQGYLKEVSRIQHDADTVLLNLEQDLEALGGEMKQVEDTTVRLNDQREAIDAARMEIEMLEAPEAAEQLKAHLLDLYSEGSLLLEELATTGSYRIATEPIFFRYESISSSFSEKIKSANDVEGIILCLREYESSLASLAEQARPIKPPLISMHSHKRFLVNLNTMQSGLAETITALEHDDKAGLEAASAKMAAIEGGGEQTRLEIKSEREADIKDYNAQIQRLRELSIQIGQDQIELHERFDRK